MTTLDPKQFSVSVHEAEAVTFHDMVAEQLRHSPWLLLSAALHAIAFLVLWALVPVDRKPESKNFAEVVPQAQPEVEPPPEPEKIIEPKVEEPTDDIVLTDEPILETNDPVEVADTTQSDTMSAFTSNQWNTAVGSGGGAAGPYGGRRKGGNGTGAPKSIQPTIARALEWLARHQDEDGRWDCDLFGKHDLPGFAACDGAGSSVHDIGVTGLALLAFLGDNHTMRSGSYREVVRRGVLWLREQQQPNGLFGTNTSHDYIYDHAIAAYAMCEAYGLSRYTTLQPVAQNAINYLESHRNPYGVWRYQPHDLDNDTSVTGWCVMAYESAKYFGLTVNQTALDLAANWFDQVSDATGRHGYRALGELSSRKGGDHATRFPVEKGEAMTAVGLFCRFFLGQDPKEKTVMQAATALIGQKPPVWDEAGGAIDHYYWYYATYAMFQVGGRPWTEWQKHLQKAVVKTQHSDAGDKNRLGSWDPVGAWGGDGGRVYSTAILTLTLQAYYRY
ncbi:MAG: terpene cyclase/mutase family protein, partial [Planctomycetes bacterium]|nr:terpene cyclase/mutase family protein [Planctomycetota bacterium]